MSIPLERLYHYIEDVAEEIFGDRVLIYRFSPDGSKKISDLKVLNPRDLWKHEVICSQIYCNDQEPLNYEFYNLCREEFIKTLVFRNVCMEAGVRPMENQNFRSGFSIYRLAILLHSEQRSLQLKLYQESNFVPVYYWSHALIALDWFRYAEHVTQKKRIQKTFLIYNRAWSGTREYRLKFAELLIRVGLELNCTMSISAIEPELEIHYDMHQFANPAFRPRHVIENYFPIGTAKSHYSADFDLIDYEATDIEVVLETLFDDPRLHLTEKSLRPIACGQPFILSATVGSLEYLRSYGFKTFNNVWDESYDQIQDPVERLTAIVELMRRIANWSPEIRKEKLQQAQQICDHNKKHFFSEQFSNQINTELKINLAAGFEQIIQNFDPDHWIKRWEYIMSHESVYNFLKNNSSEKKPSLGHVQEVISYLHSLKNK
jgi:hypothetical protein